MTRDYHIFISSFTCLICRW